MAGRDYQGAYKTDPGRRADVTSRRRQLRALGLCINGGFELGTPGRFGVVHGPAEPVSGKCERCMRIAKEGR
jgi:hypothetical protein